MGGNSYPIVLVHGFLGWGRDEMPGYYYWGGRTDLEALLQDSGHKVFSVSVGPISSNYDRAIEHLRYALELAGNNFQLNEVLQTKIENVFATQEELKDFT